MSSSTHSSTTYQSLQIQLVQNAPDDGPVRSEACRAKLKCWLKFTHWDHTVYLVGLHIYYKMIHGPYNVMCNTYLTQILWFFYWYTLTIDTLHKVTNAFRRSASCTVGIGSFPEIKRPGHSADHSPLLAPRLRNGWSYTSASPLCLHGHIMGWSSLGCSE